MTIQQKLIRNGGTIVQLRKFATTNFGYTMVDEKEKQEKVRVVFANVAEKYDLMNDAMSLGVHRLWKDYFVSRLKILKDSKVLDMAGGTGDIAFRILNKLKMRPQGTGSITVADINQNMLEVGKVRASKFLSSTDLNKLQWILTDAENLPFEDNHFDIYTISFGIRNCTSLDKVLSEAHRVLKPNGIFSCLEFERLNDQRIWKKIYDTYSFQLIPVLGQLLVGDFNSYKYFVESIRVFPRQEDFVRLIENHGFKKISYENISGGICSIFTGIK